LRCNNRGISLVEVSIATFLTTIAVLAILTLQPSAWKAASRSDYLGRASGILYKELAINEAIMMNCCNTTPAGGTRSVYASGLTAQAAGDATFTVQTTVAAVAGTSNAWRISVRVSWANHPGITDSIVVTRQNGFFFGCTSC